VFNFKFIKYDLEERTAKFKNQVIENSMKIRNYKLISFSF